MFILGCQERVGDIQCALENEHDGPHKDDSEDLIWAKIDEPFVVISWSHEFWLNDKNEWEMIPLSSHDHGF